MPKPLRPRILLIDDDEAFRDFLAALLGEGDRVHFRWESTGARGVETLNARSFDLVIVDYQLPDMLGLEVFDAIDRLDPRPHRVMMTGFGSIDLAVDAMKRGADDFFTKPLQDTDAFVRFVNRTLALDPPLPLPDTPAPPAATPSDNADLACDAIRQRCMQMDPPVELSRREAEITESLTRGLSNKEIAADLYISEQTVKNHLSSIYRKFGVASRAQLMRHLM